MIYYTTDGSTPTTSSTKYTGPITVSSTETIHAIATAANYVSSAVASAMYTIQLTAAMPAFSPAAGTYTTAQTVTMSDATPGALIYYTTDGTNPTTSSSKYTGPITVSSTQTIKAIAAASSYSNSGVASATYTIQPPPTFAFAGSPTSLTVASGSQGTVTLTVTPQNGFDSTVSFACTGLQPSVRLHDLISTTSYTLWNWSSHNTTHPLGCHGNGLATMELAPAFPGGTSGTSRRLSLAGKAAQGVDGAAAGNDVCRSGNAYGLRRRIVHSAVGPECPGDIDRYGERHVGLDPAVRHSNTHGELVLCPINKWQ